VPTQVFALFNSAFVHDMSLAFAARVEKLGGDPVETAFRYAYNRAPSAAEKASVREYLRQKMEAHRAEAAPARKDRKPLVRSITSELTGNEVKIEEDVDPVAYEENLQPGEAKPETRALADLALVLFNSNEFVYVY